ncbi:PTS sugar transporter subunit IIA [Collimonas sp. NPDC087041]|uniref:PTS sugar transporter subunit IIA n=1 Tax=Collimonas sp. NPDC087041 TaxID=3363960 RepID=UPI00380D7A6E
MGAEKLVQQDFLKSSFAKFLFPENIRLDVHVSNKAEVFSLIAATFEREHQLNSAQICQGLMAREKLESTALGCGVALPHAQIAGLSAPMMGFVRVRSPIDFDAPDGQPVSAMLVLLVPAKGSQEYLQILAEIADALCDERFRDDLHAASDQYAAWELFVRWRPAYAH